MKSSATSKAVTERSGANVVADRGKTGPHLDCVMPQSREDQGSGISVEVIAQRLPARVKAAPACVTFKEDVPSHVDPVHVEMSYLQLRGKSRTATRSADSGSFASQLRLHTFGMRILDSRRQRKAAVSDATLSTRRMS